MPARSANRKESPLYRGESPLRLLSRVRQTRLGEKALHRTGSDGLPLVNLSLQRDDIVLSKGMYTDLV